MSTRRINVGRLVRLTEGESVPAECFREDGNCAIGRVCRLASVLQAAEDAFYRVLDGCTLADLVENRRALVSILHLHPRAA